MLRTQLLAASVAAATVFVKDEAWLYVLGILAFVFVLASQFFQLEGARRQEHRRGDQAHGDGASWIRKPALQFGIRRFDRTDLVH